MDNRYFSRVIIENIRKPKDIIYILDNYQNENNLEKNYNTLLEKLSGHYSKQSTFINVKKAAETTSPSFNEMTLSQQVDILSGLLKAMQCNPVYPNFKPYGGPGLTGRIQINSKLKEEDLLSILYQSITGLFEKKIDLRSI